tara:strand:- start:187 stop:642 length:456 start_codon:yes stop_codon:yes gene_type:complete
MRITRKQLKSIINEELRYILSERPPLPSGEQLASALARSQHPDTWTHEQLLADPRFDPDYKAVHMRRSVAKVLHDHGDTDNFRRFAFQNSLLTISGVWTLIDAPRASKILTYNPALHYSGERTSSDPGDDVENIITTIFPGLDIFLPKPAY